MVAFTHNSNAEGVETGGCLDPLASQPSLLSGLQANERL